MFNRKAAKPKSMATRVVKKLGLKKDMTVADIGAGGGYFSFLFAKKVEQVYAYDLNPEFVAFIMDHCEEEGIKNVRAKFVKESGPEENGKFDLVFIRNVCHHIPKRTKYFKGLKRALKLDGRLVIIEYRKGKGFSFHSLFGHNVEKETLVREAGKAGFELKSDYDFLPEQNFLVFISGGN